MQTTLFNSPLLNKVVKDFADATGLASVAVNIHGMEISCYYNFTPFCQRMREDCKYSKHCRNSDRCGGLEAIKLRKPFIYECHAGLVDFSIPLIVDEQLIGFLLCGQVKLKSPIVLPKFNIPNSCWKHDKQLLIDHDAIQVVEYEKLIASVDLLKLLVETYLTKELVNQLDQDEKQSTTASKDLFSYRLDMKMKKALRYIDEHCVEDINLERVADLIYLTPSYFSKIFKKYQGVSFTTYLNQQRMKNAKHMLEHSELSIASIAKNIGYSHPSYFCKVFKQIYHMTPQDYRLLLMQQ